MVRTEMKAEWNGTVIARSPAAAWYYPEPKDAAAQIRGRVASWKGVTVTP